MIDKFGVSPFKVLFDYNNPLVFVWADNVYEKLRQNGILAGYVERDAVTRDLLPVLDETVRSGILADESATSFGISYYGDRLILDNGATSSFGKEYIVEFELIFNETNFAAVQMFDSDIIISNADTITFCGLDFALSSFVVNHLYKFKFVRNGLFASVSVDGISWGTKRLATDTTTTFTVVYESANAGVAPDFNNDFSNDFLI